MASESKGAVIAALVGNASIAILKFIGAATTGSSSMLSEAVHSSVDVGDQVLLLVGLKRSRKRADEDHPFGHGKELFFWSLIVAVLIFGLGGGISIYEGILHIRNPEPLEDPTWNYAILAASALFEGASLLFGIRAVYKQEAVPNGFAGLLRALSASTDPSVFTVVAEDSAAIAGLVIAAGALWLSHQLRAAWIDGVGSIGIGLLLAGVAGFLIYRCRDLLIGQGVDPEISRRIRELGQSVHHVQHVREPLTMYSGPKQVLLALNVQFTPTASAAEVSGAIEEMETIIRRDLPEIRQIFIEAQSLRCRTPNEAGSPTSAPDGTKFGADSV